MKKYLLTLSAVFLLLISSCKKDSKKDQTKDCQLTESTINSISGDTQQASFTYDEKNRVKTVNYNDGSSDVYAYSDTQITLTASGNVITTYKLDASGRITSESYNDNSSKINYTYNGDGYLIEENEVVGGNTYKTKYAYTNGNLTSVEYGTDKITISYNNEPAPGNYHSNADSDISSNGILKSYFGKGSKNLMIKSMYTDGYAETYSYEKDVDGNITKVTMTTNDAKGYTSINKYNCK